MKIKAELIQGSNNIAANVPIYTFRLTFPKKNAFLDFFGLSKYFEKWLTVTILRTDTYVDDLLFNVEYAANSSTFVKLHEQVCRITQFSEKIFDIARNGGRLSGAEAQEAIDLFGARLQDTLKVYRPGEYHQPHVGSGHEYVATATDWQFVK